MYFAAVRDGQVRAALEIVGITLGEAGMRNYTENSRRAERQMEYRRRKQMRKLQRNLFLLVLGMILAFFALRIRELSAHLVEVQTTLKQIEALQQKAVETINGYDNTDADGEQQITGQHTSGQQFADYVNSVPSVKPDRPVKRTREEAVRRLEELGQTEPVIAEISRNSSFYPENLLTALANNPEMAEFAAGYLEKAKTAAGGLTEKEKKQSFPLFLQWDPRWGYASYGVDSNIGLSGCGPTCLSMVLYYLTGDETLTPDRVAAYAMDNGYYVEGTGTAWALMQDVPGLYGVRVGETEMSEYAFRDALSKGRVLICAMSAGDFTAAGHFIVIYGYEQGGFMVNDPNCVARSRLRWDFDEIRGQIKMVWSYELRGKQPEEEKAVTFVDFAG